MRKILVAVLLSAAATAAGAAPMLTNGSFETGGFAGWTVGGNPQSSGVSINNTYLGSYYWGPAYSVKSDGNYGGWYVGNGNNTFTLTQTVTLAAGTYDYGMSFGSNTPGNAGGFGGNDGISIDGVFTRLFNTSSGTGLVAATGFKALTAGVHTIQFSFNNSGTGASGFSFDNLYLNSRDAEVPEPAMLGLFGLGAIGLGLTRRRRA